MAIGANRPRPTRFAANLTHLRIAADLSQRQLADAIGEIQTLVSHWERGIGEPRLSQLTTLAKYFECTIDELAGTLRPAIPDSELINTIQELAIENDQLQDARVRVTNLYYARDAFPISLNNRTLIPTTETYQKLSRLFKLKESCLAHNDIMED